MNYLIRSIHDYSWEEINKFKNNINETKKNMIKIMNQKRMVQSVIGEILLSQLLKESGINYNDIIVKYNNNGKPYISNYSIYYSISHDDDMIICAINNYPIGVDIIKKERMKNDISNFFCNYDELNYVKSVNDLCKIFSLKEAYIKLLGLSIHDINNISIVENNKISLDKSILYKNIDYNGYYISICYKNSER